MKPKALQKPDEPVIRAGANAPLRPPAPAQPTRVVVIEDDAFVRTGLLELLGARGNLVCCDEAGSSAAAAQSVTKHRPELVLIDLQLEDGDAFALLHSLRLQFPAMAVLVLSQQDEALYAQKALEAGARGYLMKEAAGDHLLEAIDTVLNGNTYLSQTMLARLGRAGQPGCSASLPGLR